MRGMLPTVCPAAGNGAAPAWIPLRYDDRIAAEDVSSARVTGITDVDGLWTVTTATTGSAGSSLANRARLRWAWPDGYVGDGRDTLWIRIRPVAVTDANTIRPFVLIGAGWASNTLAAGVGHNGSGAWRAASESGSGTVTLTAASEASGTGLDMQGLVLPRSWHNPAIMGIVSAILAGSTGGGKSVNGTSTINVGAAITGDRIEMGLSHITAGTAGQTAEIQFRVDYALTRSPA